MDVEFDSVVPSRLLIDPPATSSKSILAKQQVQINPLDQTEYDTIGNKIISFYISSLDSFLSGPESYLQFKITVTTAETYNNVTYIPWNWNIEFSAAGYASLFKNMRIYAADSGELIERREYSNLVTSFMNDMLGTVENDGEGVQRSLSILSDLTPKPADSEWMISGTSFVVTRQVVNSAFKIVGAASNFLYELYPGCAIEIGGCWGVVLYVADASTCYGYTDSIIATTNYECRAYRYEVYDALLAAVNGGGFIAPFDATSYRAKKIVSASPKILQNDMYINMTLPLEFLKYNVPLFAMQGGIRIELELDTENDIFHEALVPSKVKGKDIKIKLAEVQLKAMMILPHQDLYNSYMSDLKSTSGLLYKIPGIRVRKVAGQLGETSTTIYAACGARSVRRVSVLLRDSLLHGSAGALTQSIDVFTKYLCSRITRYTFRVGSSNFPSHGVKFQEYKKHISQVFDVPYTSINNLSYRNIVTNVSSLNATTASNTYNATTNFGTIKEPVDFVMCCDLSRDNSLTGTLTGTDLSTMNLELNIERSYSYNSVYSGNPMYYFIIEFDSFARITPEGVQVLQ